MKRILAFVLLLSLCVSVIGCVTEETESNSEISSVDTVSDAMEDAVHGEADYQTVSFSSFEELAQFAALANIEDGNLYVELEGKPAQVTKTEAKELISALNDMPIAVLNTDEYELAVISCRIYLSRDDYSIELVYNGVADRLRIGTVMFDGTLTADTNVTAVVADNLSLGEYSMEMNTMVKENNYCDIKGRTVIGDHLVYAAYKGGTALPEQIKQSVTVTSLGELIKPYIK